MLGLIFNKLKRLERAICRQSGEPDGSFNAVILVSRFEKSKLHKTIIDF